MAKSWFELLESSISPLPRNLPEGIFDIDDIGNVGLAFPNKQAEERFKKAIVDFFVEYFYAHKNVRMKEFMDSLERAILIKILSTFNGNQRSTADFLGLNHTTLNQKIKKHNIRFRKTPISP